MRALKSPYISDGLETWKKYYKDLDNLSYSMRNDESIINAKARAITVINFLESYPNGVEIEDLPETEVNKIMKELKVA